MGCNEKGQWNKFAEKTGLPKIKEWDTKEKEVGAGISQDEEEKLLGQTSVTLKMVLKRMSCPEAQPWPSNMGWRGFRGDLIAAVGGLVVNDYRTDSLAVLFPITIGEKVRGGVKAVYEKREGQTGYITMRGGEWVERYGLFPYGYTAKVIKKYEFNFVVLVEGPRDALRLLKHGIPALAVLGANTMSRTKAIFIEVLGIDMIYVMPDNDTGGSAMWKNTQAVFKYTQIKRLRLPREYDSAGKLIKMDPFNSPKYVLDNLKDLLRKNNDWKPGKLYLEKKQ